MVDLAMQVRCACCQTGKFFCAAVRFLGILIFRSRGNEASGSGRALARVGGDRARMHETGERGWSATEIQTGKFLELNIAVTNSRACTRPNPDRPIPVGTHAHAYARAHVPTRSSS